MTPEGKKLFKIAGMVLIGLFVLMFAVAHLSTEEKAQDGKVDGRKKIDLAVSQSNDISSEDDEEDVVEYSAKQRLVKLLHADAYNQFKSERLKNAIRLWQIAVYLDPNNPVLNASLDGATEVLKNLIKENKDIAKKDWDALRFERSIDFYKRAANYAENFAPDDYDQIMRDITRVERKMAR